MSEITGITEVIKILTKRSIADRIKMASCAGPYTASIFTYDPSPEVRAALARNRYCLDVLAHDPDKNVRIAVAEEGGELDTLVNDPDPDVRIAVADLGIPKYRDILINDQEPRVAYAAMNPRKPLCKVLNLTARVIYEMINADNS